MSQRHCVEADTVGEPPGKAAVKLQCTAPVLNPSTRPQSKRSRNQPHQAGRCRPSVACQSGQRPGPDTPGRSAPYMVRTAHPWTLWILASPIPIAPHAIIHLRERGKISRPDRTPPRFELPARHGSSHTIRPGRPGRRLEGFDFTCATTAHQPYSTPQNCHPSSVPT